MAQSIATSITRITRAFDGHTERRAQHRRRVALLLATLGIDCGPRLIHGVEVRR